MIWARRDSFTGCHPHGDGGKVERHERLGRHEEVKHTRALQINKFDLLCLDTPLQGLGFRLERTSLLWVVNYQIQASEVWDLKSKFTASQNHD